MAQQSDWDISVEDLKSLRDDGASFQFIDVREPREYEVSDLGAELIPLGTLPERISSLDPDAHIVVHCARCKVHEEGLVGCHRLLRLHPANGLVCHVVREVIALYVGRIHAGDAIVNQRVPLVGLTPDKAIKLVKTRVCRPAIERP